MKHSAMSVAQTIQMDLDPEAIGKVARQTGFVKRQARKIEPVLFIKTLVCMTFNTVFSLRLCAMVLGLISGTVVSKVALFKRITPHAVAFMSHVLFTLLANASQIKAEVEQGAFAHFKRVFLNDSTHLALPPALAQLFPGARNQSGKTSASLRLQVVYEVLTGVFTSFRLTPYACNDQCASSFILDILKEGDLILRDLGYFSLKVFRSIGYKDAFYLSRYRHKVALYTPDGKRFDLLLYLQKYGTLDLWLHAGAQERLPVRVVAISVPEPIAAQRRRKLLQSQKKDRRLNPGKTQLALLGWEIFITNIGEEIWNTETACRIYGVRWRIEIIIKSWKSHFHINAFDHPTATEVELLIYSRLICITLFHTCFYEQLAVRILEARGNHLSLLKTAQFFHEYFWLIFFFENHNPGGSILIEQILKHCTYEKRRRLNYEQIRHHIAKAS